MPFWLQEGGLNEWESMTADYTGMLESSWQLIGKNLVPIHLMIIQSCKLESTFHDYYTALNR